MDKKRIMDYYYGKVFDMEKGCIQIYFGQGRGKSTAAFGLLIRALGRGLSACVFQFLKSGDTGEILYLKEKHPGLPIECAGLKGFFWNMDKAEKEKLKKETSLLFGKAKNAVLNGDYDLIILDELLGAIEDGLIPQSEVIYMLKNKKCGMEVIITGRVVPVELAEMAGLITEMRMVKHHYKEGRKPKKGLEF